jgi:hypothetical protein
MESIGIDKRASILTVCAVIDVNDVGRFEGEFGCMCNLYRVGGARVLCVSSNFSLCRE